MLEMKVDNFLLTILLLLSFVTIVGLNWKTQKQVTDVKEGFQDKNQNKDKNTIGDQVRAILDPMTAPYEKDLCSLFDTIRKNMLKNEKTGAGISDAEAARKVEADLALKIPGGPLPCPFLRYPRTTATDIEWLAWLQQVPPDIGARVVFMALHAKDILQTTEQSLKAALSGQAAPPTTEPFATICTPDVIATRKAEAAKRKEISSCILPEEASLKEIREQIQDRLKLFVSQKEAVLKAKGIPMDIDIQAVLRDAKKSQVALDTSAKQAEAGTLQLTI